MTDVKTITPAGKKKFCVFTGMDCLHINAAYRFFVESVNAASERRKEAEKEIEKLLRFFAQVDTVFAEMEKASNPLTLVERKAAFLERVQEKRLLETAYREQIQACEQRHQALAGLMKSRRHSLRYPELSEPYGGYPVVNTKIARSVYEFIMGHDRGTILTINEVAILRIAAMIRNKSISADSIEFYFCVDPKTLPPGQDPWRRMEHDTKGEFILDNPLFDEWTVDFHCRFGDNESIKNIVCKGT